MISFWRHRLFHQTWHPSFEELVLHLDGQLGPRMDRIGSHIKSCWSCRSRLEQIDRAISEFMEARNASFADSPSLPPRVLARFEAQLDRLESESGRPGFFASLIRDYTTSPRQWVFAALLGLVFVLFMRLNLTQPVSAKEILLRVRDAEARQIAGVPAPVIYEKLEVRRTSRSGHETATWEIWNDTRNKRLQQRVDGAAGHPLVRDLGEVFVSHRADLGRPLSSGNYEVWRNSIRDNSEEVLEGKLPNGDRATILKASGQGPFVPGAVVTSELTVRTADWHPVGQRLSVQQRDETVDYSLGEVAFDVMALNAVPPSIFADPAPPRIEAVRLRAPRFLPVPVHVDLSDTDMLPTGAELTAAEVEARYALHSAGACVGRPIAVHVAAGRIEIEGVVDTEKRKAEVLLALRGIPHVYSEIRTVAEAEIPSTVVEAPADSETSKPKLPVEALLKRYFSEGKCQGRDAGTCVQEEIAALSRAALVHSEAAQAQAWALRRLVEWGPFLARDQLRTSTGRLLELMVRDHMDALRKELEQSRALLQPVLSTLSGQTATANQTRSMESQDSQGDQVTASLLRLCAAVEKTVSLTLGTLVETNRPASQPEQAVKELLAELDGLNGEFPKLETAVAAELPGFQPVTRR